MTRQTINLTATLLCGALAACAGGPSADEGPARVETFVGWIERVHVESELAKERAGEALVALQTLVSPDGGGDAVAAYAVLASAIDRSEQQAKNLKDAVEPMKAASKPVFQRWEKDLDGFTSERLRERSRQRLDDTRSRYEELVAVVDPALASLETFNATLRDHALFLGNDLNSSSLSILEDEVDQMGEDAVALDDLLSRTMVTSRAYVETSATPMRVETARPIGR